MVLGLPLNSYYLGFILSFPNVTLFLFRFINLELERNSIKTRTAVLLKKSFIHKRVNLEPPT